MFTNSVYRYLKYQIWPYSKVKHEHSLIQKDVYQQGSLCLGNGAGAIRKGKLESGTICDWNGLNAQLICHIHGLWLDI